MPPYGTMLCVHGLIFLLSIPIHLILLKTVWKFSKKDCFKTDFFKLLVSLTTSDTILCVYVSSLVLWLTLGGHQAFPKVTGTLTVAAYTFGYIANTVGLVAIAANRFVNIVFYEKAAHLWTERTTKIALGVQWVYAVLHFAVQLHPDNHHIYEDIGYPAVPLAPNSTLFLGSRAVFSLTGLLGTVVVLLCYAACFTKLVHHRLTSHQEGIGSLSSEIKLLAHGCVLSVALLLSLVTFVLLFVLNCSTLLCANFVLVIGVSCFFANFYTGSFIAFCMSSVLRSHLSSVFKPANQVEAL